MRSLAASEAKNRFGELLDTAQREPVSIEKHGRPVAVMISAEEYEELEALKVAALRAKVRRGLSDIDAGRVTEAERVFATLEDMIARAER